MAGAKSPGDRRAPVVPASDRRVRRFGAEAARFSAPQPRDHSYKLNGKVQRGALRSALSLRVKEGSLTVVNGLTMEKPSTKTLKGQLEEVGALRQRERVLLVDEKPSEALYLSARNLERVEVRSVFALNTYDVLAARKVLISEEAAQSLEERLSR